MLEKHVYLRVEGKGVLPFAGGNGCVAPRRAIKSTHRDGAKCQYNDYALSMKLSVRACVVHGVVQEFMVQKLQTGQKETRRKADQQFRIWQTLHRVSGYLFSGNKLPVHNYSIIWIFIWIHSNDVCFAGHGPDSEGHFRIPWSVQRYITNRHHIHEVYDTILSPSCTRRSSLSLYLTQTKPETISRRTTPWPSLGMQRVELYHTITYSWDSNDSKYVCSKLLLILIVTVVLPRFRSPVSRPY